MVTLGAAAVRNLAAAQGARGAGARGAGGARSEARGRSHTVTTPEPPEHRNRRTSDLRGRVPTGRSTHALGGKSLARSAGSRPSSASTAAPSPPARSRSAAGPRRARQVRRRARTTLSARNRAIRARAGSARSTSSCCCSAVTSASGAFRPRQAYVVVAVTMAVTWSE